MQLVQSVLNLNIFTTLLLIWLIWQAQFSCCSYSTRWHGNFFTRSGCIGTVIEAAVAAGVPVIYNELRLESSASLGALMHVGQPEYLAGQKAGERAKAEGATKALCMIQGNTALVDR